MVGILIGICIDSNRVGKILLPLLAARPMRRFSGILRLHGAVQKINPLLENSNRGFKTFCLLLVID